MGWAARARYRALAGEKCPTCAYRPGTVASQSGDGDVLLGKTKKALLEAFQPFFCHDPRYRFEGHKVLCAGHVDAMNALSAAGFYDVDDATRAARLEAARQIVELRVVYRQSLCKSAIDDMNGVS